MKKKDQNNAIKIKGKLTIEDIAKQLSSKEKLKAVENITGNTQISKTELEKLFPITVN